MGKMNGPTFFQTISCDFSFQYAENYELEEEPRQSLRQIRKSHQNPKRYAIVKKRSLRSNSINHKGLKKRTCGIMYRNKEPIGILQVCLTFMVHKSLKIQTIFTAF